jgi:hypothetical protein
VSLRNIETSGRLHSHDVRVTRAGALSARIEFVQLDGKAFS